MTKKNSGGFIRFSRSPRPLLRGDDNMVAYNRFFIKKNKCLLESLQYQTATNSDSDLKTLIFLLQQQRYISQKHDCSSTKFKNASFNECLNLCLNDFVQNVKRSLSTEIKVTNIQRTLHYKQWCSNWMQLIQCQGNKLCPKAFPIDTVLY